MPMTKHISILWSTSWPAAAPVYGLTGEDGEATVPLLPLLLPYPVVAGPLAAPVPVAPTAPTALLLLVAPAPGAL